VPDGVELHVVSYQNGLIINNDSARVKYVMNQLVSNAVKFTKQGFIVIGIQFHLNTEQVEFYVYDTGCGIPKEKQQLAFGLFWKDDGFIPGLGLGLHVAQKLADGMGLTLAVESKPGFGSRFSLYSDTHIVAAATNAAQS
jgi:signal transduction histidine kinase